MSYQLMHINLNSPLLRVMHFPISSIKYIIFNLHSSELGVKKIVFKRLQANENEEKNNTTRLAYFNAKLFVEKDLAFATICQNI